MWMKIAESLFDKRNLLTKVFSYFNPFFIFPSYVIHIRVANNLLKIEKK